MQPPEVRRVLRVHVGIEVEPRGLGPRRIAPAEPELRRVWLPAEAVRGPEQPGPDYGVWTSNANLLTNNQPPYDPAMGTYQLRALLCRVTQAEPPRVKSPGPRG